MVSIVGRSQAPGSEKTGHDLQWERPESVAYDLTAFLSAPLRLSTPSPACLQVSN
ncbi:MAG: hypothetical protein M3314_13350 [Actinomycetota bacterium]|nr:hypothetical protein [Actinomycetota bacterium]